MTYTTVTALWSGFTGAPGYSRFRFSGALTSTQATAAADRVRTFFAAVAGTLPSAVRISFAEAAQQYEVSGELIGEVAVTPVPAQVSGSSPGAYAAASGCVINWITGAVLNGRKVRGRTFLVPMATGFEVDGTLGAGTITTITNAANALQAGTPGLVVAHAQGPGLPGQQTNITGVSVPDRSAILRTRRD